MLTKLGFAGLALVATVSAHCAGTCSEALLQHPEAAAKLCHKFEKSQHSSSTSPAGSCPSVGAACVCSPASPLPYPEFASSCFEESSYVATLEAACECLKNSPGGTSSPGSGSTSPKGPSESNSAGSPGKGSNGSGENGGSSPSQAGSSPGGGSSPGQGASSPGSGPISTSSAVTTEM